MTLSFERIAVGDTISPIVRTTDFANWNRYAAVNDEFVPIHMDHDDARATGQPAAFGMGNLRTAYLHNAIAAWLGDAGTIVDYACQFRGLNFKGDTLTASATVTGKERRDGAALVHLALSVKNQDGVDTTPGTATVHLWEGEPWVLPEGEPERSSGEAHPGVHLTAEEIGRIGTTTEPVSSWPVDANDMRKWAIATWWPEPPPSSWVDDVAAAAGPWGGLVAPRDLEPFAWNQVRSFGGWLRRIGTEPGHRILNGGTRSRYFAPIRPGDRITATSRLVDVIEKATRLGPSTFFTSETRSVNQRGELVRLSAGTTLFY